MSPAVASRARRIGCTPRCAPSAVTTRTVATTRSSDGSSALRVRLSVRPPVDLDGIRALARGLGRVARGRVRIYLTGGATAVIEGWRSATLDVDLRFEPEADELLRALVELKDRLGVNVELVSPPDFIPELPGWRERSPFLFREGNVDVHHFDPYSQALSKIERGFEHDLEDVRRFIASGMVEIDELRRMFDAIEPELYRYPAIDPAAFTARLRAFADPS